MIVQAAIVKDNDKESIDCANWVVSLSLFDIAVICTNHIHCVDEFDIIHPAYNSI